MPAQERLSQIRDLVNQLEQLAGYTVSVPDWAVNEMADEPDRYETFYDVGQYMLNHTGAGGAYFVGEGFRNMPWAHFGMTLTEYDTHLAAFNGSFRQLTGVDAPQDVINQALAQNQGRMSGPQFETWLLSQDNIKQQYGWLRYGLDFQQFQTQKLSMRQGFGRELTDAEAVAQLQYRHAAQGANVGVQAQQSQTAQERKQAGVGVSGSVVR